jgi:hypothetical protein
MNQTAFDTKVAKRTKKDIGFLSVAALRNIAFGVPFPA